MRLYLLPISTRRTLIYCERAADNAPAAKVGWVDWGVNKANATWADWEKSDTWWKTKATTYGNMVFRRIPFEEWGLKSIPPLKNSSGEQKQLGTKSTIEVRYPKLYQGLCNESPLDTLRRLGTERQGLHQKRLWGSVVAMPFTAPVALIPVIPNIPFLYLVFRAWSHYKALAGSRHLAHLIQNSLVKEAPSSTLDALYTAGLLHPSRTAIRANAEPSLDQTKQVVEKIQQKTTVAGDTFPKPMMLLQIWNGKLIAERLKLPDLEVEIERAVEQVEKALKTEAEAESSANQAAKASTASPESASPAPEKPKL